MKNKTNGIGVIIGRFQPFHLGHAWLIKKSLEKFEKIIILVGSSNIDDINNPWDLNSRIEMIEKFIAKEKIEDRIIKIEHIEDIPSDDEWLKIALKKISIKDFTVIGDNDWVNEIFENSRYRVWRAGYSNRELWEGTKIRKLLKEDENWQDRVPQYLIELIRF